MKLIQGFLILLLILLFFKLAPVIIWILKLLLAIGFISLAYKEFNRNKFFLAFLYLLLALLFQPLINLGFGRVIWFTLELFVIVLLLILIFDKQEN